MDTFEARTGPFVQAMVAACHGELKAQRDISQLVGQMMQDPATRHLGQILTQIIIGRRDRENLIPGLEGEPLALVNKILNQLNT